MNRKVESAEPEGCRRRISVEVEPAQVRARRDEELKRHASRASLPGFRPGRAPEDVVRSHFREEIEKAALEGLLTESCRSAIESSGLEPVTDPSIENLSFGEENLSYQVVFDVAPKVEIEDYRDISLQGDSAGASGEEVEKMLGRVLDADPDLRRRALDIKEREKIRSEIRDRMEAEQRYRVEREQENLIMEQLLLRARLDVPEGLVEKRAAALAGQEIRRTMPGFARRTEAEKESTARELMAKLRPAAEKDVKASFVIEEVAEREKVTVSDEDLSGRVEMLARLSGKSREEVETELGERGRGDLRNRIRIEKTFDILRRRCLLLEKPRIIRA